MKYYSAVRIGAFLMLLVFASGTAYGSDTVYRDKVQDTVKKAYDVRPGGTIYLDLDHGNVEVESIRSNRCLIEIERVVEADDRRDAEEILERHEYSFDKSGDEIRVRSRFSKEDGFMSRWRNRARLKIRVIVQVPEQFNVDFSSGAGNVEIRELTGSFEGRTGAGNIAMRAVQGSVDVNTGAGNIDIEGDLTRTDVNTGAGNIDLRGSLGSLSANSGAGNVYAEITRQPEDASDLTSGAGNVTVRLADDVRVYAVGIASVGSCDTDFPLKVEGKWLKKTFSGQINGGGPELRMKAGVGNVSLKKY